jgi:hypothetical protein
MLGVGLMAIVGVGSFAWRAQGAKDELPEYALDFPGLKGPISFLVGGKVKAVLRPMSAVSTPLSVSAYWESDGQIKPWATTNTVTKGTVEVVGFVDAPFGGVNANFAFVVTSATAASPPPAKCLPPNCRVVRGAARLVRPIVPSP